MHREGVDPHTGLDVAGLLGVWSPVVVFVSAALAPESTEWRGSVHGVLRALV